MNFWKINSLDLNEAEVGVIGEVINVDQNAIEEWISDYLFGLWRKHIHFKINKSPDKKNKILVKLSELEEKLECSFIEPTHYIFYEVFKNSKEIFNFVADHANYRTKTYLSKNFENYKELSAEQLFKKHEEMLLLDMESTFQLAYGNCVYAHMDEMVQLFNGQDMKACKELLTKYSKWVVETNKT